MKKILTCANSAFHSQIGFYGVYSTSLTLQFSAFLYGVFWVRDIPRSMAKPIGNQKPFLADFFDLAHINDTLRVTFKQGKQNRRAKVIMLMLVVMIVSGPWYGMYRCNKNLTL